MTVRRHVKVHKYYAKTTFEGRAEFYFFLIRTDSTMYIENYTTFSSSEISEKGNGLTMMYMFF